MIEMGVPNKEIMRGMFQSLARWWIDRQRALSVDDLALTFMRATVGPMQAKIAISPRGDF